MTTLTVDVGAEKVWFDEETMWLALSDGRTLGIPLAWFPRLLHGTPQQRQRFELGPDGIDIHWVELNEDVSVEGLIAGRGDRTSRGEFAEIDYPWVAGWPEGRKLAAIGIATTPKLLEAGGTAQGRARLAEQTGIDAEQIRAWVNRADRMRIERLSDTWSDVLAMAGIQRLSDLAACAGQSLRERLVTTLASEGWSIDPPPAHEIDGWIREAKRLPMLVSS